MADDINIRINVTEGDIRGISTIRAHLAELNTQSRRAVIAALNDLTSQWNAARQRLGVEAMQSSMAIPGLELRRLTAGGLPGGAVPPSSAAEFWRRVRAGGAISPAAVGPLQGPGFGPGDLRGLYGFAAERGMSARGRIYGPGFNDLRGYDPDYPLAARPGRRTRGALYGPGFDDMRGYDPAYPRGARPGRPSMNRLYGPGFDDMGGYDPEAPSAGPGRRSGGRFYGPGFGPGDFRGYEDYPYTVGPGRSSRGRFYGPGFGPGDTRGYENYPYTVGPGRRTYGRFYGPGFGPDDLSGLRGSGYDPRGAGMFSRMATGLYGMVHGPARVAMGAVAGVGLYSVLTESMELYRQRAKGVLDIGMQQDLQFKRIGETIDRLRSGPLKMLAQDSIAAMLALGRVTGGRAGVDAAARFGAAHGLDPTMVGTAAGTLQMLTTGTEPLTRAFGAARARFGRGGALPMGPEALMSDLTQMAAFGGAAAVPMPAELLGGWAGLIGTFGQRYRLPGQTAATYGQLAEAVGPSSDPTTQALRMRAVDRWHRARVAQGLGSRVTIGTGEGAVPVDLSTIQGKRIALENAISNPALLGQMLQLSNEYGGINPDQRAMMFEQVMLGGRFNATQSAQIQRVLTPQVLQTLSRGGTLTQEQQSELTRIGVRAGTPEFQTTQAVEAAAEGGLERMGGALVKASSELRMAMADLMNVFKDGTLQWSALTAALSRLSPNTMGLMGGMMALGANSGFGQAIGVGMIGMGLGETLYDRLPGARPGISLGVTPPWLGKDPGGYEQPIIPERTP